MVSDTVIGVLHVGTLEQRFFNADDRELLELVASRTAIAIERARIHDEVVRLDQMKVNFVAIASHELRTPATSIYGIAATIKQRGDALSEDERNELDTALWSQANRLRGLIEQLLDLSRLDARAIVIEPQPLALHGLLKEIVAGAAPEADVRIEVPEELEVNADRDALERIFANLVANAAKYGEPPVVVRAQSLDSYVRVSVQDEGEGVAEELVPRLFERFERGGAGQGTGLGLSIAQAYARAHGGDLVYDTSSDGGAKFELILPRT
jgi:signal transduction histidine kinase